MGLYQTKKFLHHEGNYQQNEKTTSRVAEDMVQEIYLIRINNQNIQRTHTTPNKINPKKFNPRYTTIIKLLKTKDK